MTNTYYSDEEFVREDWTPTIAEQIPVMGEAVAGLHLGEDNEVSQLTTLFIDIHR